MVQKKFYHLLTNYCGLGGSGVPINAIDRLCKQHDTDYGQLLKSGKSIKEVYWNYNTADEKFLNSLAKLVPQSRSETVVKLASRWFFKVKKSVSTNILQSNSVSNLPGSTQAYRMPRFKRKFTGDEISPIKPSKPVMEMDVDWEGDTTNEDLTYDDALNENAEGTVEASFAGYSAQTKGSHETKVMPAQPDYQLPETHTARLTFATWLSMTDCQWAQPVSLEINMVDPKTPIISTVTHPTAAAAYTQGIFDEQVPSFSGAVGAWANPLYSYPQTYSTTLLPGMWRYYVKLYEYFHVTNCHYRITMQNCSENQSGDVCIFYTNNVYGSTKTGNVIPTNQPINIAMHWKNLHRKVLPTRPNKAEDTQAFVIIEGDYKPGQGRRNVHNDEDVKTWTAVASAPTLTEDLAILFYQSPFAQDHGFVRMQIELWYDVQFKDLVEIGRYPGNQASSSLFVPNDIICRP